MGLAWTNEGNFTMTSGEALAADRFVKISDSTLVYADAGEEPVGITQEAVASGDPVAVHPINATGVSKVTGSTDITAGSAIYTAADGKISDTVSGRRIGTLLEAISADGGKAAALLNIFGDNVINYDTIYGQHLTSTDQDINEASDTQNYSLGTRRVTPDGEEYVYACAGATINTDVGVWTNDTQHIAYTTIAATVAAGVTSITLDVQSGDGAAGDGAIAADELIGGRVVIFPHSNNSFVRTITDNTATTGAGEITLTLNKAIPVALTVDVDHGEAMASKYLDVRTGNCSGRRPFLGAGTVAATVGQYFWILRSGITWLAPQAEVGVGDNDNQVTFRHDGSLDEHDYSDALNTKAQHAGTVLTRASGETQGAPFVQLQGA